MVISIVSSIMILALGIFMIVKPLVILSLQDAWRLEGKRQYTDFAVASIQITGGILIFGSLLLIGFVYNMYFKPIVVTFSVDGDTSIFEEVNVQPGNYIDLTAYEPTKEGYEFVCWTNTYITYSQYAEFTVYCTNNLYKPNGDTTLRAVFTDDTGG